MCANTWPDDTSTGINGLNNLYHNLYSALPDLAATSQQPAPITVDPPLYRLPPPPPPNLTPAPPK